MRTVTEQQPAPKGLFAHIQENNFRSVLLFAWFVVFLECLYVSSSIILISLGSPIEQMLRISFGMTPLETSSTLSVGASKMANPPAMVPKSGGEIWSRFWERDALLGSIALIVLALSVVYVLASLWWCTSLTRRQVAAIRVRRQDEPRLYGILEPLTIARGLPMPTLEVIPDAGLNAYTSGYSPKTSVIGVSRGLLDTLTDGELEAVLAHELAHIENRDNRLMTLANLCAGVVTRNSRRTVEHIQDKPLQTIIGFGAAFFIAAWEGLFVGYGIIVLAFFLSQSVKHLIAQKREFVADARAIEMIKDPTALMTALHKIAGNDVIEGLDPRLQAMMISNASGSDQWTHPSTSDRIAAIEATTGATLAEALQQRPRENQERWAGAREYFPQRASSFAASPYEAPSGNLHRHAILEPADKSSTKKERAYFGRRDQGSTSTLRSEIFSDTSYGAEQQWTADELRSEQWVKKVEATKQNVSSITEMGNNIVHAITRRLWMLPFVMVGVVAVFALPFWFAIGVLTVGAYTTWQTVSRKQRLAAVERKVVDL